LFREPASALDRTWYIDLFGGGKTNVWSDRGRGPDALRKSVRFPGFLLFPPKAPVQK
jgi:hypothetical protein